MDFLDLAKRRYSVRSYKETPVEEEKVARILEAARVSPSAANLQPTRLVVVDDKAGMGKLSRAANVYSAPLAIIVCADHAKAWKRPADGKSTVDIDAAIATDHMMMGGNKSRAWERVDMLVRPRSRRTRVRPSRNP